MESPLVSIVVPVYNVRRYVVDCLVSIAGQSFKDFEVIVVDDGSTDGSYDVCHDYIDSISDGRFRLYHKANGGLADARNFGLRHCSASSEYVVFADSDDELAPNCISELLKDADRSRLVIGTLFRCEKTKRPVLGGTSKTQIFANIWNNPEFLKLLKSGILNSGCAKCYSLDVIRENGLSFENTLPEDTLFNIRYLGIVDEVVLNRTPIYYYYIWPQSMSTRPSELVFKNYIGIQKELCGRVAPEYCKQIDLFVYPQYRVNSLGFIKNKDFATPLRYLKNSLVRRALKSYKPVSAGDFIVNMFLRMRLVRLLSWLSLW